jgi:hypothetical protein
MQTNSFSATMVSPFPKHSIDRQECAIFVDKHGEPSRTDVINWHGRATAVQVIGTVYVIAFDTSFMEIWRCDSEIRLVQVIPGRDIQLIGKEEERKDLGMGPATGHFRKLYVTMGHPERFHVQIVLALSL